MIRRPPRSTLFPTRRSSDLAVSSRERLSTIAVPSSKGWASASGGSIHSSPSERSEEHTSELQSHSDLVCRLLLEKKKKRYINVLQESNTNQHTNVICSAQLH